MLELKNSKLYMLLDEEQQSVLKDCVKYVSKLWDNPLIQHYTEHGVNHSYRILGVIEKFPKICEDDFLSNEENFLLLLGVFMHDIGMQCDIRKHYPIKEKVEKIYNASFDVPINKNDCKFSMEQQNAIRRNHHLLTGAWIEYAFINDPGSDLGFALRRIPSMLMSDFIDICIFHSKLDVKQCKEISAHNQKIRVQLIAAILRLGDELDIGEDRINRVVFNNFILPEENSVFWYMHLNTKVQIIDGFIKIIFTLHPNDYKNYRAYLINELSLLVRKNKYLLNVLAKYKIYLSFDEHSEFVIPDRFAIEFPSYLAEYFEKKAVEDKFDANVALRYVQHELAQSLLAGESVLLKMEQHIRREGKSDSTDKHFFMMIEDLKSTLGVIGVIAGNNQMLGEITKKTWFSVWQHSIFKYRDIFRNEAREKKMNLVLPFIHIGDPQRGFIYGDPLSIEQCIYNLLGNALKYGYEGTNVYIDCIKREVSESHCITIKNFGLPINIENSENIFKLGVRLDESSEGRGMGLYIVNNIAQMHSGCVYYTCKIISDFNVSYIKMVIDYFQNSQSISYEEQVILNKLLAEDERLQYEGLYEQTVYNHLTYNKTRITPPYMISRVCQPTYEVEFCLEIPSEQIQKEV